jgi:predicted PurR-regulated permease PerM
MIGEPIRGSVRALGIYVRGQILLSLSLAGVYAVAFWILRVPFWPIIAIAGGLASVIPRIGSLIPLGLAVVALDFAGAPLRQFFGLLAAWLAIQCLSFFVLLPRLISRPLGLREFPVFAALLLGSLLFGPIGLLLAVPLLAVGAVFWRHFRRERRQSSKP